MTALNQEYFCRPEYRLIAAGTNIDRISPEATAHSSRAPKAYLLRRLGSNGGIENPTRKLLPSGKMLIRFSRGPFVNQLASGDWWLDLDSNALIEKYAARNRLTIQQAVSRLCAVPAEWNDMTLKSIFVTLAPLLAYAGPGKDAFYEERGTGHIKRSKVDTVDGRKVEQLYIPGLNDPDLCRRALLEKGSLHMPAFGRS